MRLTVRRPLLSDVLDDTRARTAASRDWSAEAEEAVSAPLILAFGRLGAGGLEVEEGEGAAVDVDAAILGPGGPPATPSTSDRWRVMRASISACRRLNSPGSGTGEELCEYIT